MDRINSPIRGRTVAASALHIGAAALTATLMLLFAPGVSADELICEVLRDDRSQQYLINIDDRRSTVTVADADVADACARFSCSNYGAELGSSGDKKFQREIRPIAKGNPSLTPPSGPLRTVALAVSGGDP